ncbi:hypothetical protein QE152_g1447 [Popillia japonica]|uniref:Uncharacterized protein n=1 Tax=Popillia japonica TaxID=7064 RepID=A0AAW1N472_POPJA
MDLFRCVLLLKSMSSITGTLCVKREPINSIDLFSLSIIGIVSDVFVLKDSLSQNMFQFDYFNFLELVRLGCIKSNWVRSEARSNVDYYYYKIFIVKCLNILYSQLKLVDNDIGFVVLPRNN